MRETLPIMPEQGGRVQPEFVGTQQQFGKVDHPAALARLFVGAINLQLCLEEQIAVVFDVFRPQALVLVRIDEPHRLAGRPLLFIQLQSIDGPLHQTQLIVCIEYLEILRQAGFLPVTSEEAVGNAVKRTHPHAAGRHGQQRFDAATHFRGSLVGEGYGQNAER